MRRSCGRSAVLVLAALGAACQAPPSDQARPAARDAAQGWQVTRGPDVPMAIANNAVAAAVVDGRPRLYSFLGLGAARDYRAITSAAFALDPEAGGWQRLPDVPGRTGRLAATAQAIGARVYIFGGYEVAADGRETTSPATDIWVADEGRYERGADAPVALDDAVSGVWRDRLIYLVSGWSTDRTVTTVQAYEPATNRWIAATPIPGTPVFGHAGGLVDDTLVYCGGARMLGAATPKYGASAECYRGEISPEDPAAIVWRAIAPHPGPARYRAAAGPVRTESMTGILFVGGTANPYNYDGIGYDGRPSTPEAGSWIYDIKADVWIAGPSFETPTMDHRGLVSTGDAWWTIGGFAGDQAVTSRVSRLVRRVSAH